ncbi:TIM barrel protein [Novosphingobium sp. FSY-8]|uniref:TIM barrel protein n=1 Tax=Novosphingobium ovatum TaxID=1908523 RepID=A0ABW9XA95_9SPHN|nr:sugar phosphate isomerase/epimerase family protein [Novosphingobium ovatum]NBC35450.1 TIM barrel protein [Novosphingobium ovatum]
MPTLAVSSFSLHSQLGPLHLERREADGTLACTTYPFPQDHSLEEFAALVRERLGVKAVELCQIQFDAKDPARIAALRKGLDDAGVRLLTLPIDLGDFGGTNPQWRADDEARSIEWFRIAAQLGAEFVRVNAGAPGGTLSPEVRPALVDSLRRLGDAANALGLTLLVENHGGTSSDVDFLLALLQDVGPERLGLLLDLGNLEPLVSLSHARFSDPSMDVSEINFEPLYDSIAKLAPHARLVHAKSVDPASDGRPLPDLPRALAIVAAAGYAGHVSIEWEGRLGDPWEQTAGVIAQVRAAFPDLD